MSKSGLIIALLCVICSDTLAETRRTCILSGVVQDQTENVPLPGASVEISSPVLITASRSVTTSEEGRFRFAELPPGLYQISVELPGYNTVTLKNVEVYVGMTAEIPISLSLQTIEQTVTVHAYSRFLDPSTSSFQTIFPQEFIRNVPGDRDSSHILDFAPGINLESAYGGGEESGNSYELDGVDISDPQSGSPWALFNYSLIDQVELVGLGAPAEYGQFTGVVFNTITKSGTNQFSGSAEIYYTDDHLTSSASSADLVSQVDQQAEGNIQLGGPIQKEKLWYFVSAQYVNNRQSEGGPVETEKTPRVFLKLSYAPNKTNTVDGWMEWTHTKITGRDGDAFTPLEATTGEDNPEIVGHASWKSILTENTSVTVDWGGYAGHHHFNPLNGSSIPGHVDAQTGRASANAMQFAVIERNRNQINASVSHHANHLLAGDHDFLFGTEIEHSNVHDRYGFPGDAFFSDNEGPETDPSTGSDDFFTLAFLGGGYDARGTGNRVSLFAQDSWRVLPGLTINPGVRIDIDRGSVSDGTTVYKTNAVAPRIGFAWDLNNNGNSIFRGHYGRYYEALYAAFYYYMDPGAFFPLTTQRIFNSSGFKETVSFNSGQQYAMDPDIRQPRLDQWIFGYDQRLPYGIVFNATGVYRRNADLIETVSRDGIFVPASGTIPGTGQKVTLFDYLNSGNDVLLYTNPNGLQRTYQGFLFSASKYLRNDWQLIGSYVYSKTRGNIDNLGFDETGGGGNTPFFDGHFLDTPNSLVNAQGRLTHDQTHQIKLQSTWILPSLNLFLSTNYTYHSGDTWTPQEDCLLTDDGNGINGDGIFDCHEFLQGPVIYFAESRGSRRLTPRNDLDVRVEWRQDLSGGQQFAVFADFFNITNQTRVTSVDPFAGEEFGESATVNFPRNIRLGFQYSW